MSQSRFNSIVFETSQRALPLHFAEISRECKLIKIRKGKNNRFLALILFSVYEVHWKVFVWSVFGCIANSVKRSRKPSSVFQWPSSLNDVYIRRTCAIVKTYKKNNFYRRNGFYTCRTLLTTPLVTLVNLVSCLKSRLYDCDSFYTYVNF